MRAKVFQATFFLFLFNSFYSFTPSVLATTNVSSSDHWPSLNRVLNDFLWPMRGSVVRNIEEVLRDDRVYKLSPACNASLAYFVAGLSCNREDAFRGEYSWAEKLAKCLDLLLNLFFHLLLHMHQSSTRGVKCARVSCRASTRTSVTGTSVCQLFYTSHRASKRSLVSIVCTTWLGLCTNRLTKTKLQSRDTNHPGSDI